MGIDPIRYDSANVDMRNRFYVSKTIVASPATNAETIIAQLTVTEDVQLDEGVWLHGWAAFTVGTSGTACRLRIRRATVAGTVVADTGAVTGGIAAANLVTMSVDDFDAGATLGGQVYCLTLQVTAGAAASTVSATTLKAIAV